MSCCQEVTNIRTHYPYLYGSERAFRTISFAVLVITCLAAIFTLTLEQRKGNQSETGLITDEDVKIMGIITGCLAGGALLTRLGSSVCGCVRERLDNRRNGVLVPVELAQLNV